MVDVDGNGNRRASPSRSLLLVLLAVTVILAAGSWFLVLRTRATALDQPVHPLSDEQSRAQVVEPAKQIVALGNLQSASGGYILMSCENQSDPPYQGAVYLTFDVPESVGYFDQLAAAMVSRGWQKGVPPNQYLLGTNLHKDGVTAILYRDPDRRTSGIGKVYGECRNVTNHRDDTTGWTDITGELPV